MSAAGNATPPRVSDTQVRTTSFQQPFTTPKATKRRRTELTPTLDRRQTRGMTRTTANPQPARSGPFFENVMFDAPPANPLPPPATPPRSTPQVHDNHHVMRSQEPDLPCGVNVEMGPATSIPNSALAFVPMRQSTSPMRTETSITALGATEGPIDLNADSIKADGATASPDTRTNKESVNLITSSDEEDQNEDAVALATTHQHHISPIAPPPPTQSEASPLPRTRTPPPLSPRSEGNNASNLDVGDDDEVQVIETNNDHVPLMAGEKQFISAYPSSRNRAKSASPAKQEYTPTRQTPRLSAGDGELGRSFERQKAKMEKRARSPYRSSQEPINSRNSNLETMDDSKAAQVIDPVNLDGGEPMDLSGTIPADSSPPKQGTFIEEGKGTVDVSTRGDGFSSMDESDLKTEDDVKEEDVKDKTTKEDDDEKNEVKQQDDEAVDEHVISPENQTLFTFPPTGRGRIRVTYADYLRVLNHEYLNDTVLDFFIKLMEKELNLTHPDLRPGDDYHFFSTFFFGRLRPSPALKPRNIDYNGVSRWTSTVDLFSKKLVFVPICESAHWSLIIMANLHELESCLKSEKFYKSLNESQKPRMVYLDSLDPKRGRNFIKTMFEYLVREYANRKLVKPNPGEEEKEDLKEVLKDVLCANWPLVPLQVNEVDCGLYLLHNMQCFIDNKDGFRDMCLVDIEPEGKLQRRKQPNCRGLYSHSAIQRLREYVLGRIRIMERSNATNRGEVPDENAKLLCDKIPVKKLPSNEDPHFGNASMMNADGVNSSYDVASIGAFDLATHSDAFDQIEDKDDDRDGVYEVGSNVQIPIPPEGGRRKSRRLGAKLEKRRKILDGLPKRLVEISPNQMYGKANEAPGGEARNSSRSFSRREPSSTSAPGPEDSDVQVVQNDDAKVLGGRMPSRRSAVMPKSQASDEPMEVENGNQNDGAMSQGPNDDAVVILD